jgi:hypothetical protein
MGRLEIGAIFSVVSPRAAHSLRLNVVWHAFTYVSNRLVADPTDAAIFPKFANDDFAPLSGREFVSELPENLIPDAAYAWTNLLPLSDGANSRSGLLGRSRFGYRGEAGKARFCGVSGSCFTLS